MLNINNKSSFWLWILFLAFTSCSKYEEGSKFTLLTKKARLCGEWDIKNYIFIGSPATADIDERTYTFEKDGIFFQKIDGYRQYGEWEFIKKKEKLRTTIKDGNIIYQSEYLILKLTDKELWLKDKNMTTIKYEKIG